MRLAPITAALLVAACGRSSSAPWLTYPGVQGHERFLLLAGTSHDPAAGAVSCDSCHPGTSFTQFDCIGCHTHSDQAALSASHAAWGVAGFTFTSAGCYGCHRNGLAAPANHSTAFFPVGPGSAHAGIACTQCHADPSRPADPTAFGCATCHLALPGFFQHGPVGGVAILTVHTSRTTVGPPVSLTSQNCLRCHADSQVDRIASHPGGDSALGNGDHLDAGCTTCHPGMRADKPFGASFGSANGCPTCHG